jgi:DNA-binding NtrC family response regulator
MTTDSGLNSTGFELNNTFNFPENLIERAYILSSNQKIGADDLPLAQKEAAPANGNGVHPAELSIPFAPSFDLTRVLESAEKEPILRTLNATHGAQAEAARRMGLSRSALAYKLTKYGIRSTQ